MTIGTCISSVNTSISTSIVGIPCAVYSGSRVFPSDLYTISAKRNRFEDFHVSDVM